MNRYLIFNNGQYREIVEGKNKDEALVKAIQLGYIGEIELIRMKKHELTNWTIKRIKPKTWTKYYPDRLLNI